MGTLHKDKRIWKQLCDDFFLEKETFPNEFVDKIKKGILCLNISLLKIVLFMT